MIARFTADLDARSTKLPPGSTWAASSPPRRRDRSRWRSRATWTQSQVRRRLRRP